MDKDHCKERNFGLKNYNYVDEDQRRSMLNIPYRKSNKIKVR